MCGCILGGRGGRGVDEVQKAIKNPQHKGKQTNPGFLDL